MVFLPLSPYASNWLNFLRWLSALLVVVGHLRSIVFVSWQGVQDKSIFNQALYFITRFGHEAVVVFFIISGFLVGSTTLKRIKQGRFDFKDYLIARFSRIYVVLLPALILGFVFDYLGYTYFNADDFYRTGNGFSMTFKYDIVSRLTWKNFWGNLLMLQNYNGYSTFGSNSPLWSLSYEWFYYMLFPLLPLSYFAKTRVKKGIYFGLSALLFFFMPSDMRFYFGIWLLGIGIPFINLVYLSKIHVFVFIALTGFTFVLKEVVFNVLDHRFITDFAIGISLMLLLSKLMTISPKETSRFAYVHEKMAGFSYSVYLLHLPLIVILVNIFTLAGIEALHIQPTLMGLLTFVVLLVLSLFICYIFSLLTEKHTEKVKRFVSTAIKKTKQKNLEPSFVNTSNMPETVQ